ncbi:MAG: exosortase/archaeosortase family protein [Lentimonas sp.]
MPIRKQLAATFVKKMRTADFWIHCLVYGFLLISLLPISLWVAETAESQSRIFHALVVLVFACVLLVRFGRIEIKQPLSLNPSARGYLYTAFALIVTSVLLKQLLPADNPSIAMIVGLISIPAYCSSLGSLILFVFGSGTKRLTRTAVLTFCTFLLLSIFMQPLDWPLRSLAGQWSGGILDLIGKNVEFALHRAAETGAPQLLMFVNDHPFHVASECNGFGVILTSLLLAFMLAIYRRLGVVDILLNIVAGAILGFIFNTLRIVVIVLLAPSLMDHYHLMHEIVGTISYWSCLALLWVFLNGPIKDEQAPRQTHRHN